MTREVCFIISKSGAILWADASTSPIALPDSRTRWEAIWQHRDELFAIAHSHPAGPAAFSDEDLSTMAALDSALGRALHYYVVTPGVTISNIGTVDPEPWWAELLRLASGMRKRE